MEIGEIVYSVGPVGALIRLSEANSQWSMLVDDGLNEIHHEDQGVVIDPAGATARWWNQISLVENWK